MPRNVRKTGEKFFVCRQHYWGIENEDAFIVEIAIGGSDYANPDMLHPNWTSLGEGKEFSDPREAVEAAIKVCEAWRGIGNEYVKVAYGFTGGDTMPFEPKEYDDARRWAEKLYEKLPKCAECGNLLGDETYTHEFVMDDEKFCCEYCAEKNHDRHLEEMLPDDEDKDDD